MSHLICLPSFNEAENIAFMIDELLRCGYTDYIISDANSTDGTAQIAKDKGARILPRTGHGKGYAIKDALNFAAANEYESVIFLDCDRTYPVDDIVKLIQAFPGNDMVVGCRNFRDIDWPRNWANVIMTGWTNLVFWANVQDMATGMRMIRVNKFKGKITAQSFDVEPQMHGLALRNKWKIQEVSINYNKRVGSSKINIGHLFLILYRVVSERLKFT
jgi:glycosyltransferase involved in cell wall biosynthesis